MMTKEEPKKSMAKIIVIISKVFSMPLFVLKTWLSPPKTEDKPEPLA